MGAQFFGDVTPLQMADYAEAARQLGCSVAALRAVALVESAGAGFLADGRPKILFERHVFHARTRGRFGEDHARVSSPRPGGYLGGAREYERLSAAMDLDRRAALLSTSWGKFQLMGFNHALAGYETVEAFVTAMVSGEPAQLAGFVAFIQARGLVGALVRQDWAAFARGYNGPAYARNSYDRRMAEAYARFASEDMACGARPVLTLGALGAAVTDLQSMLDLIPDGRFGQATQKAVIAFQDKAGLVPDGIVGAQTWAALLG